MERTNRWLAAVSFLVASGCASTLTQTPPRTAGQFAGISLDGGRTHAVAVNPTNRAVVVLSTQFGGLWRTVDDGAHWDRLFNLQAVFSRDVEYGADGRTLVATLSVDNRAANGGGLWLSRDGGDTWARPTSGGEVPSDARTPARGSAHGLSRAPDDAREWFAGTDFGVAHSADDGANWTHASVDSGLGVAGDRLQNRVTSVLALGQGRVLAMTRNALYRSDDHGRAGTWRAVRAESFTFYEDDFNRMDRTETGAWAFVMRDYNTLYRYDVESDTFSTIPVPPGGASRWPYVRVAKGGSGRGIQLWIGQGLWSAYVYRSTVVRLGTVTPTSWTLVGRDQGVHDDTGDLGVDASGQPVFIGSDGGVFRPAEAGNVATWTRAAALGSGFNSYQITDLGGTNREGTTRTTLYYTTQDNAIWSSNDAGATWPNSDCAEGFHMEVRARANPTSAITAAYGKVGCGPSSTMLSDEHLVNQRAVGDVSVSGGALTNMGAAFWLKQDDGVGNNYFVRARTPPGSAAEIHVSSDAARSWRKRFDLNLAPAGVFQRTGMSNTPEDYPYRAIGAWLPVFTGANNADGSMQIGLVRLGRFHLNQVDTVDDSDLVRLPGNGSLGLRATEFDWQAVVGVNPRGGLIIAPDIVAGDVKVTRDGGSVWTTDAALTQLVTQSGALRLYDGPYHMQVTHISFDPYRPERILVGTRDAGIICSADGGASWNSIAYSTRINYITGFFFLPSGEAVVSSYGHGLWRVSADATACPRPTLSRSSTGAERIPSRWTIEAEEQIFPPPSGRAEPNRPKLFVSTERPAGGLPVVGREGRVVIFGRGFERLAGTQLEVNLDGKQIKAPPPTVDPKGQLTLALQLPEELPRGQHQIELRQPGGNGPLAVALVVVAELDEHLGRKQELPPSTPPEKNVDPDEKQ